MKAEEELTLPPWEKFLKYGLFPFKLTIHLALLGIVTSLVLLVNISFSGYSRAIWMSMVNVLYPPDYVNFQLDTSSPYQYFLYTQNQTVRDVNYLTNNYFQLPDISVNNLEVYNTSFHSQQTYTEDNQGILPPKVTITSKSGTTDYILYSPDDNGGFPLAINNIGQISVKEFFHDLKSMTIEVYLKSYGITDTSHANSENICFHWKWSFFYHANNLAQISVNAKASIISHCDNYTLPASSTIYALSLTLMICAIWYQVLLIKAVWRQLILLNLLRSSRWEALLHLQQQTLASVAVDDHSTEAKAKAKKQKKRKSRNSSNTSYRTRMFRLNEEDGEENARDLDDEEELDRGHQHSTARTTGMPTTSSSGDLFQDALQLSCSHGTHSSDDDSDHNSTHIESLLHASSSRHSSHRRGGGSLSQASSSTALSTAMSQRGRQLTYDWNMLQQALHSLTWQDKLLIVNLWFVIGTIGNFFALLFAGRMVVNHSDIMAERFLKIGLGLSCLAYWCSLVQYLEFFPRYYIMISMLKITVPRVSQFLLGVLPLFFGYALLGMTCFSDVSVKFGDILETLRTLFSVVNGDIIYDTFYDIDDAGLGGQLYVYVYILLFTYVVLMTIIAIVEEAFFEAQEQKSITNSTASSGVVSRPKKRGEDSDDGTNTEGRDSAQLDHSNRPSDVAGSSVGGKRDGVEEEHHNTGNNNNNSANNSFHFSASSSSAAATTSQGNSSVFGGKRNLPDHVRFLLQNVDKLPSSSTLNTGGNSTPKPSAQPSPQKPFETKTTNNVVDI